jgi:predicted metalloprotease
VEFDDDARLDAGQVQDRRGRSGGGRMPGGRLAIGGIGGVAGLLVVLVLAVLGGGDGSGSDVFGLQDPAYDATTEDWSSDLAEECRTGADANEREDCRIVGVVNSVQAWWGDEFRSSGLQYRSADTQLFTGSTVSGCGAASSATGPFYCPADATVYMDLGFFQVLTRPPFDAEGGPFAQAYVIAHEYGHHVQNLLGRSDGGSREGAASGSVRLELQADCYAGVWAAHALATGFVTEISDDDIATALDAAAAVGDDRIQEGTSGRSDPETFTHGTSAQRQEWFRRGFDRGDPADCDTFSGGL